MHLVSQMFCFWKIIAVWEEITPRDMLWRENNQLCWSTFLACYFINPPLLHRFIAWHSHFLSLLRLLWVLTQYEIYSALLIHLNNVSVILWLWQNLFEVCSVHFALPCHVTEHRIFPASAVSAIYCIFSDSFIAFVLRTWRDAGYL